MTPSPRKTARPTFEQTWDATNAGFLDPTALPIAKIPRAWERKQETKINTQGKQKTVWRRYATRSRGKDVAQDDEDEEDEEAHDARARPVKKLQRMSPKAMEHPASTRRGPKRGYNATRWDRRKSVLPRKKAIVFELPVDGAGAGQEEVDESGDDAQDRPSAEMLSDAAPEVSFEERGNTVSEPLPPPVPDEQDRRAKFTFSVQEAASERSKPPCPTSLVSAAVASSPAAWPELASCDQVATIARLFRSPKKGTPTCIAEEIPRDVRYLKLLQSFNDDDEVESLEPTYLSDADRAREDVQIENDQAAADEHVSDASRQAALKEDAHLDGMKQEPSDGTQQTALEAVILEGGMPYLALPPLAPSDQGEHPVTQTEACMQDVVYDRPLTLYEGKMASDNEEESLDKQSDSSDDDFTEASLQLDIQRDVEMEIQQNGNLSTPKEEQNQSIAVAQDFDQTAHALTDQTSPRSNSEESVAAEDEPASTIEPDDPIKDITAGLHLDLAAPLRLKPTPRRMQSSSPPVEPDIGDATVTLALDDDTAMLKDFLSRAAASKASKAAVISRRESLQNRRDSDVVRHALASPRKILEDKDPNSPSKYDKEGTLDLSQTLTLNADQQDVPSPTEGLGDAGGAQEPKAANNSRRSSRARKSRLPAPAAPQPAGPPKIAVRRADGGDPIVLKKSDAQELSNLTRTNTRKNKQGAFAVSVRLLKLANDAVMRPADDTPVKSASGVVEGKKYVRWDEQLAYYREFIDTAANMLADAESLATPDELSLPTPIVKAKPRAAKELKEKDKSTTPKIRRVRGLGTANGTPRKGLLAPATLLPDSLHEEDEAVQPPLQAQRLPKPKIKASKMKKTPVASTIPTTGPDAPPALIPTPPSRLPTLDMAPASFEPSTSNPAPAAERKSRLAMPRKVQLPQPTSVTVSDGKENQRRVGVGLGLAASPAKKGIALFGVVPPAAASGKSGGNGGAETGLPRRRAVRRL